MLHFTLRLVVLLTVGMISLITGSLVAHTPPPLKLKTHEAVTELTKPILGDGPVIPVITRLQDELKQQGANPRTLIQLGRFLIAQARLAHDELLYQKAELCGQLLYRLDASNPEALLLRGHSLLAMHRFHDAEHVARELLKSRQEMQDHALLGDALMEQGELEEALPVYQAMIDAKPCLPSYSRVAHVRWLRGDVDGAIEIAEQAINCGSYRDPEPLAWVTTRLAFYLWQKGDLEGAIKVAERAEQLVPDYGHALFVRGRVLLAARRADDAVKCLSRAVARLPLPEVRWALADAYRAAGQLSKAEEEERLMNDRLDPRSFSLYLATLKQRTEKALALAKAELRSRKDVHSWDALAWAQHAAGESKAALISSRKALAEGTLDARILLHAAHIARGASQPDLAAHYMAEAQRLKHQLLPSEQVLLDTENFAASAE
jgi:tetratricopeptide (TPR) repeat protein